MIADFTIQAKGAVLLEFRCNTSEATRYVQTNPSIQWWQPVRGGFAILAQDLSETKARILAAGLTITGPK